MSKDEKCRKCGEVLFKVVPLPPDGRYWAMCDETELELKSDDVDSFFECPYCGAKNVVSMEHPLGEPPQYEIAFWK